MTDEQILIYGAAAGALLISLSLLALLYRLDKRQRRTHRLTKDLYSSLQQIKQNQNAMALTQEEIKAKLENMNTTLDTMSGNLDNISTDNAEQIAMIKELKEKLENMPEIPQEISDLVEAIDAKATSIGEKAKNAADEWPTEEPQA